MIKMNRLNQVSVSVERKSSEEKMKTGNETQQDHIL